MLVDDLLIDLIGTLSNQQETALDLPQVSSRISRLLDYLCEHRCLLVLDNAETILQKERAGYYREGYEGYGELPQRIGETRHQSCLVLTSREKPRDVAVLEGETLPVRSLILGGLNAIEGEAILTHRGNFTASDADWQRLIQYYAGNPLALQILAPAIQELFASNISNFLNFLGDIPFVFDDIRDLLEKQFLRLSEAEKEVMYWLAIHRESISFSELQTDLLSPSSRQKLLETLKGLGWRSLIEKTTSGFTQQPVVMEYITECLIDCAYTEISTGKVEILCTHALIKVTAKDYLRDSQIRLILQPLGDRLLHTFKSKDAIAAQLKHIIQTLRDCRSAGYAGGNVINLLHQLKINLTGYDFSHLPIRQAYLCDLELHRVNFAGSDLTDSVFLQNFSSAIAVAFSPDGNLLATGDIDGAIRLWQVETGQPVLVLKGHKLWVRSIAFSTDGQTLLSGSYDQTVKLWHLQTGDCQTFWGHTGIVWSVAFSHNGYIASAGFDRAVKLWDAQTGCRYTFEGCSVAFGADGKTLLSGDYEGAIKVWDIETGVCLQTLVGHQGLVSAVICSHDGKILVSCSHDRTINLWNRQTGHCRHLKGHKSEIWAIALSQNQILASASDDGILKLWEVKTGRCLKTWQGHANPICAVAFSPDGRTLVSGGEDRAIALWNVPTGQCIKTLQGFTNQVRSVAFSRDGYLASGGEDCAVRVWNADGVCLHTLRGHTHHVTSVAFSSDGQTLASGSYDYSIRLWDVTTGQCLKVLQIRGYLSRIQAIAYSRDGILASGSVGKGKTMLRLWNTVTGDYFEMPDYLYMVLAVAFAPKAQILASAGEECVVRLWDLATKECIQVLSGHTNVIHAVTFSPDGCLLASGSGDATIKLWDVSTGKCLQTLSGNRGLVYAVAFSLDSRILASSSGDATIKLWDVFTGECWQTLQESTGWSYTLAFSPHNLADSILASGNQDGTIRFWNIKTGQIQKMLKAKRPYEEMNITDVSGLTESTIATLKGLGAIAF